MGRGVFRWGEGGPCGFAEESKAKKKIWAKVVFRCKVGDNYKAAREKAKKEKKGRRQQL